MSWATGRDTRRVLTVTYQVGLAAKPMQPKSWWRNSTRRSSALILGYRGSYATRNILAIGSPSSKETAEPSSPRRAKLHKLQTFFERSPANCQRTSDSQGPFRGPFLFSD